MQSIQTLSLTPNVKSWLAKSRYPRLLHVFDHACNLINEHREVLSVVTAQIGNGPFNLVVENEVYFSEYLTCESPVIVSHHHLHLGDLIIDTADAPFWSPCPDWEMLHARRNHILLQLNQLRITNDREASLSDQFPLSSLSFALVSADIPTALALTAQLAGLGPGLTPSGDDILIGALYATWIVHSPEFASFITREIANTAAPLTTSLSAALLRSAGKGEAGILWHELFRALIAGEAIQHPVSRLLSVGETSGADAMGGFMGIFNTTMFR